MAFFEIEDILIPRIAPTYIEEFEKIISELRKPVYLIYKQDNYGAVGTRKGLEYSIKVMLGSLSYKKEVFNSIQNDFGQTIILSG